MKTLLKVFLLLMFSIVSTAGIYAQRTVTGTVTDQDRQPVPGANIVVKGTQTGATTDANGKYTITVPTTGATLVVSFVGYTTQEVAVGNSSVINVTLQTEAVSLEEVVVVGYGTQKKSSVTGALTSMKAEDVKFIPVPALSNTLAGRLSGVYVTQRSGAPGFAASIRVRAINTWKSTGLDPLYVIDGIVSDKRAFDALDVSAVDNITVLKDAASGAIYGARAANGVILVTTKTGNVGKFQLNYNYSYSFDQPSKIPSYVDAKDMVRLMNDARANENLPPAYDAQEVAFFNENDPARAWYTLAYKDPTLQKHSLTASGGTDKVKYFLAGTFFDQTAFIKNADYQRYTFRSNIDVDFTKNLKGIFNVAYSQGTKTRFVMQEDNVGFDTNADFGALWGRLLYYLPTVPPKTKDGKFIDPGWIGNMLAFVEEGGMNTRIERNVDMLLGLTYNIPFVDGLSVSGKFAPKYAGMTMKQYELKTTLYQVKKLGTNSAIYTDEITGTIKSAYPNKERLVRVQEATQSYQLNFAANYAKKFGQHDINAVLVYEQSEGNYDYFYGLREGFPLLQKDQFWATSAARTDGQVSGTESEFGRASFIGRLAYSFGDKYFINATARRDGSMLFAPDKRWGTFPSVSAGWMLSRENFFKVSFIDDLKLRASWGLAGNDAVGGWRWSESFATAGDYLLGTAAQPRVRYSGIINPDLTWEKTSELNVGIDARFLKGIMFSAEYYKRHNYDILDSRILSLPNSFGGAMPPVNYGIVDGQGVELELGYVGNKGDFSYQIKGNFGYSVNKVILRDVAQNVRALDDPNGKSTDYIRCLVATDIIRTQADLDALPAGYTIYGLKPKLGMINFEDVSGVTDGVADGKIDSYDRQIIEGSHALAPYMVGLNLSVNWKGFGIDVFLQGITGVSKFYNDGYGRRFFDGARPPSFWLDSWSPDNTDAAYPRPITWDRSMDHLESTFWLKNSSYLRLQYLNFTYSLPKSLCQKIKIADVTLILSGTNLFTMTKFDYFDPSGSEMRSYPTMKSFTMGANITF
ncbi:MAG: TonB-dependent receptor [Bacteroidales bacterium]